MLSLLLALAAGGAQESEYIRATVGGSNYEAKIVDYKKWSRGIQWTPQNSFDSHHGAVMASAEDSKGRRWTFSVGFKAKAPNEFDFKKPSATSLSLMDSKLASSLGAKLKDPKNALMLSADTRKGLVVTFATLDLTKGIMKGTFSGKLFATEVGQKSMRHSQFVKVENGSFFLRFKKQGIWK